MTEVNILTLKEISIRLFEAGVIKIGNFTVQNGTDTPIYFDLRVIVSYPDLLNDLSILLSQRVLDVVQTNPAIGRVICGIPFAAITLATLVSVHTHIPMILKRQTAKSYGTRKMIEGLWKRGDSCMLVDDVIMFGDSVLETAEQLNAEGLNCTHAFIICDREQGAAEKVRNRTGIEVVALLKLSEILGHLLNEGYVSEEDCSRIKDYLANNQTS